MLEHLRLLLYAVTSLICLTSLMDWKSYFMPVLVDPHFYSLGSHCRLRRPVRGEVGFPIHVAFLQASLPPRDYLEIVVQCTRKTELRSWRTLFTYIMTFLFVLKSLQHKEISNCSFERVKFQGLLK
jgi:hypothetical protein